MSGVGIQEAAGTRVEHAEKHGDEHATVVAVAQLRVDGIERGRRTFVIADHGFEQCPRDHGEQRGGNSLAGHVCDRQRQPVFVDLEVIVEVAADFLGGIDQRLDVVMRIFRQFVGQRRHLHLAGDFELPLDRNQLVPRLQRSLQFPHVGDAFLQRDLEIREIDRLGQEIEGAAIHGGTDIAHVAVS